MKQPSIDVFVDESANGKLSISIVLSGGKNIEYNDEQVPGCHLTPSLARKLAIALEECAARVESY